MARIIKRERQDFWESAFYNQHARKAFRAFASMQMRYMQAHVMGKLAPCESPLEAAFYTWWLVVHAVGASSLELIPQHEVIAGGKTYRLDFVVRPVRGERFTVLVGAETAPKVAIELDGHHYHDKTPAQATKRNKRDRVLMADGWTVLHLSYAEFHDDPISAVVSMAEGASAVFEAAMSGRLLKA